MACELLPALRGSLAAETTVTVSLAYLCFVIGEGSGVVPTMAKVFGWAFAWWGIGLYWWAGILYAYQVFKRGLAGTPW